jgi:hypothetical protein
LPLGRGKANHIVNALTLAGQRSAGEEPHLITLASSPRNAWTTLCRDARPTCSCSQACVFR